MRRRPFAPLPLSLLALSIVAVHLEAAGAAAPARHPSWKLQGPRATVHLTGSIHFLKPEHYPLAAPIDAAFRAAEIVVFETDLKAAQDPRTAARMQELGRCPAGKTIRDFLLPETQLALAEYLRGSRQEPDAFDTFKPWFASVTLVVLELQKLGFSPDQGMDMHFLRRAEKEAKTIEALETLDFQLNLFGKLSREDQEMFLKETLAEIGAFHEVFEDSLVAWKAGDMTRLDTLLLKSMRDHPRLYRTFITDRNKAWVKRIEQYLRGDRPVFIVVGAGHLAGPGSVLELLERKGIRAEQLSGPG